MENNKKKAIGHIIELHGGQLLRKFINMENMENYQFIIVSTDILTNESVPSIKLMTELIPNQVVSDSYFAGDKAQYKLDCLKFYMREEQSSCITILMKSIVDNGFDLVLVCSDEEADMGYIKILRKFIKKKYQFPSYTYDEWKHAKVNGVFKEVKNVDKLKKIVHKEVKNIIKQNHSVGRAKLEKSLIFLQQMTYEDMIKFCKNKEYKKFKKLDEDELREFIEKKLRKEYNRLCEEGKI